MFFNSRLMGFLKGVEARIALAVGLGLLAVAAGLGRLAFSGLLIARIFEGDSLQSLTHLIAVVVVLTLARSVLQYAKEAVSERTAGTVKVRLRRHLYEHALALGPGQADQLRTGDLALALVDGVERLEIFFGRYLPQFIIAFTAPLMIFGLMSFLDVGLAAIFLTFAFISLFLPSLFERWNRRSSQERRVAYAELASEFLDGTQGIATLKALGQGRAWDERLALKARALYRRTMSVLAVNLSTTGASMLCVIAGSAVALGWGAVRVTDGALDMRVLVIVLLLGVEVFRPVRDLTRLFHDGMNAMAAAQAIFSFLDTQPAVRSALVTGTSGTTLRPEITIRDVDFAYSADRPAALKGVSLTAKAAQTTGIVGPSGAGKSTLVWLLLRFYDPQAGSVSIGGRDVRDIKLEELRELIAVVSQDMYLFHGSVIDNLRFARPDATMAEIEAAARSANAHGFITQLPQGYDTLIGERGVRLSGGQRQRIAIARALLKDAPVLILDEALSSVDTENEGLIQEALDRLKADRTTLVIAHRLSSVIGADHIFVLDEGRVVEEGTHDSLITASGTYERLFRSQQYQGGEARTALDDDRGDRDASRVPETRERAIEELESPRLDTPSVLKRLVQLVSPWKGELALTMTFGLLNQVAILGTSVVGALLVGRVYTGDVIEPYLIALAIVAPLTAVFTWAEMWLAHDVAYRLLAEMRIALFGKLERLAPAYTIRRRSGEVSSVMASDIETIELFFAHTITPALIAVVIPVGVLLALAIIAWPVALVLLPFLAVVALSPFLGQKHSERLGGEVRRELGELHSHVIDSVQGMREVLSFGRGASRSGEMEHQGEVLVRRQLQLRRQQSAQVGFTEAMMGLGGLACLVAGAALVSNGELSRHQLPLVTMLSLASFAPVAEIARTLRGLSETIESARRLLAVHDEPVLVTDGPLQGETEAVPSMRFDGVTFAYNPANPAAVSDAHLQVAPGQTMALVGRSGAGKSTCSYLFLRFWDPQAGQVSLDEVDLRQYGLEGLHRSVAWVSQDTFLFNMTLRDNIRLGCPGASDAEVEAAARAASIHEFISSLPEGYDTVAGERGVRISGGQRQRIAIARALIMRSPVLVLDEATSHLDAENEELVRAGIRDLTQGRTTIVIAHRLSTIREADRIVVLDKGRVVEEGTHEELLRHGDVYSKLVSRQAVRSGVSPEL